LKDLAKLSLESPQIIFERKANAMDVFALLMSRLLSMAASPCAVIDPSGSQRQFAVRPTYFWSSSGGSLVVLLTHRVNILSASRCGPDSPHQLNFQWSLLASFLLSKGSCLF
jgi:hypothetical protein